MIAEGISPLSLTSTIKQMAWETFINTTKLLTFEQVQTSYPSGVYSEDHGCYFFLDQDDELGYFIQYSNDHFEDEPQWADLDTLADDERAECEAIAEQIARNR